MNRSATSKNIVLYADDDADDLDLVQDAFYRYSRNVDVVIAKNGVEALDYLQSLSESDTAPCLIILDMNMPVIGGREVLKKLRQINRFESVPVVLFTTSSSSGDQAFASQYQAGFVTKPLDVQQMEMITETFIDHCADEVKKKIRRHLH